MSDRTLKAILVMEVAQWHEASRSAGDDVDTLEAKLKRLGEAAGDSSGTDRLVKNQQRVRESSSDTSDALDEVGKSIEGLDHHQLSLAEVDTALGRAAEDAKVKGEQIGQGLGNGVEKGLGDLPEKIRPTTDKLPEPFGPSGDKAAATFEENFAKHRGDFTRFAHEFSDEFYAGFEGDTEAALARVNELFNERLAAGGFDAATRFRESFSTRVTSGMQDSGNAAANTFEENFKRHHDDFVAFAASLSRDFYARFGQDGAAALAEVNRLFNRRLQDGAYDGAKIFSAGFAKTISSGKGDELSTWLGKMLPGAAKSGVQAGDIFGNGIVDGAVNAFKLLRSLPPEAQAAIIGMAVGAGALASSFLAASLNAALLGAVGSLGLAAGIVAESQDPRIQAAWANLKNSAAVTLTAAANNFVEPVERGVETISQAIDKAEPDARRFFDALAPSVDRLSNGLGILVDDVMAGLADSGEADAQVLDAVADILPIVGSGIKIFFDEIKGGGPGAADALRFIATLITGLLILVGNGIEVFSMLFHVIASGVADSLLYIKVLVDAAADWNASFRGVANQVDKLYDKLTASTGAAKGAKDATDSYGQSADSAAQDAQKLSAALEQNTTDYDNLIGANLSAASAELQLRNALAGVTQAAQENGTSLDQNTAAGRANEQALLDAANAARSKADAVRQQTANTQGATAGDYAFATSLGNSAAQLYATATAAGFNRGQVANLISTMTGIPPNIVTQFLSPGGAGVKALVDYINAHAVDKTVTITYQGVDYTSHQQIPPGFSSNKRLGGINHAATGLIAGATTAGVYSDGPFVMFAEPSTVEEAFVPKSTPDVPRARAITEQAAAWHGGHVQWGNGPVQYAPMASGAGGYASAAEIADRLAQRLAPLVGNVQNTFNAVESDPAKISEQIWFTLQARG